MSAYKEGKFYFDKLFVDNWTLTPVHYAGQEFINTGIEKWVNPSFQPTLRENASLSKTAKRITANLFIPCWAETDVDVMELMDEVTDFIESETGSDYQILNSSVIDHGWHDSNKVFGVLMFTVTYTVGTCNATAPTVPTVPTIPVNQVINNGVPVVNNAHTIIN